MPTHEMLNAAPRTADAHQSPEQDAVVIDLLHDDAQLPRRATEGSAGYDLFAYLNGRTVECSDGVRRWSIATEAVAGDWRVVLSPGAMALIPLGFKARLPNGYEAQIRPRSGAAFKKGLGIPNAPGTVDSDFPDEWRVIVRNTTEHPLEIAHGERIAQMVLHRYEVLPFVSGKVGVSTERTGGFGSTGG
jgi:dUTP pyrophosphatase